MPDEQGDGRPHDVSAISICLIFMAVRRSWPVRQETGVLLWDGMLCVNPVSGTQSSTVTNTSATWGKAMGGFSILHWLIVAGFFLAPLVVVVVIVLVVRASRRSNPPVRRASLPPIPASASTEERLLELESLRAKGLMSDSEYQQRRQAVIQSL